MTPDKIAEEIIDLANEIRTKENNVYVSGLVQRGDLWNDKVLETNRCLEARCVSENLTFIKNMNIIPMYHLNRSKLHLNIKGTQTLAKDFLFYLGF